MKIDVGEVQVLYAHLQPGLVRTSLTEAPEKIERAAAALAKGAALLGIPSTFGLVPVEEGTRGPIEVLTPYASDDVCFTASAANPFLHEGLRRRVLGLGRNVLVVGGFASEVAVFHSALGALDAGLRVVVAVDAIGSLSARAERAALDRICQAGGEVMSVSGILSLLTPDFSQEPGTTVLSLIGDIGADAPAPRHAVPEPGMRIARNGSAPPITGKVPDNFTGSVRIDNTAQGDEPSRVGTASVTFTPGARTAWHRHPAGQTVIVTAGTGWAQCEGGPVEVIRPGDTVFFPANVQHWHGASATSGMTHIAITEKLDGTNVEWLEPVSDDDYRRQS